MAVQSSASPRKLAPGELRSRLGLWSSGEGALYRQLAEALAGLVDEGVLRAGDQLPAERACATELSVSRGTVVKAYELLAEQAAVERIQGSGTRVAGRHHEHGRASDFVGDPLWQRDRRNSSINLLKAIPEMMPEVFEVLDQVDLRRLGPAINDAEPLGLMSLRQRIAEHHTRIGVPTNAEQILVTAGAQQAFALMVAMLIQPGDTVVGEALTWPGLIDGVHNAGARFHGVPVGASGLDVEAVEWAVQRYRPVAIVINQHHHNPTGSRLPPARAAELARISRDYGVPVIEDRVAAHLAFDGQVGQPVAAHDPDGPGVVLQSLSKVAWPGLRLGWLRADAQLVNRSRSYKSVADMFTSIHSQAAGELLLDRFDEIVRGRVEQLRARSDLVCDTIETQLPEWRLSRPRGGMAAWVELPAPASGDAFVHHAAQHGLLLGSGRQFAAEPADSRFLRLPFTAETEVLRTGLERMVEAWRSFEPDQMTSSVWSG